MTLCAIGASGCNDPTMENDSSTDNMVDFSANGWSNSTNSSLDLSSMTVEVDADADELIITCPESYIPAPNFSGSVSLTATSTFSSQASGSLVPSMTVYGLRVVKEGGASVLDYSVANMSVASLEFNINHIDVFCLPGSPSDWTITKPA